MRCAHTTALAGARDLVTATDQLRHHAARQLGIALSDTVILGQLGTHGPRTARMLADAVHLTPGAVTAAVDRLERHHLVHRSHDRHDRRRVTVALTAAGQQTYSELNDLLEQAVTTIDAARLPALGDDLSTLAAAVRAHTERLQLTPRPRRTS